MRRPVVAAGLGNGQVVGNGGGGLIGRPASGLERPESITGADDAPRLTLALAIIVERPVQVGLGVLGDGAQRLGVDSEPALPGQASATAGTAWLWQEKQSRCLGYTSALALTSRGNARKTAARIDSARGCSLRSGVVARS